MKDLQIFNYEETPVRVVDRDGSPWWVLADVCRVLALSNPSKVAGRLDEDEKQRIEFNPNSELGLGHNGATIISESGLYKVILRSDKPEAKKFTRWVTHEVLPAIRKTGSYNVSDDGDMEQGEFLAKLASKTKDNRQRAILIAQAANIGMGWEVLPVPAYGQGKDVGFADTPADDCGVAGFLETADVINRPTYEVHADYVRWCRENRIEPTNKINFSKVVSRIGGYRVIDKHIHQKKYRLFAKM